MLRALPLWLFWGCASSLPVINTDGPPLRQVTIEVGDQLEMHLAGAWLSEAGDGRGVAVEATASGAPPMEISGKKSSWKLDEGVVRFEGEVVATRGDFAVRADVLEVRWVDDRVSTAEATGHVVVTKDGRVAQANRGVLDADSGKFTLEGDAQIVEGGHQMRGASIVLWLDDERLECVECVLVLDGSALGAP